MDQNTTNALSLRQHSGRILARPAEVVNSTTRNRTCRPARALSILARASACWGATRVFIAWCLQFSDIPVRSSLIIAVDTLSCS
jgi:hypothetical protein